MKNSRNVSIIFTTVLTFITLVLIQCKSEAVSNSVYTKPEKLKDGIKVGTLSGAGIETAKIEKAISKIRGGRFKEVHSMLIYRNGKLVCEEYFRGGRYKWDSGNFLGEEIQWGVNDLHYLMSASKSISSLVVGIAVDKCYIKNVNQSASEYLTNYDAFLTDGKQNITIEHLLTMTSGLQWDEWNHSLHSKNNDIIQTFFVSDPIAYTVSKPLKNEPGTHFTYCGGNILLLSEIVSNSTKMRFDEFTIKNLFKPLGIKSYYWREYKSGLVDTSGGIRLTPRDMLKIGVLCLNKGKWKGKRIVSEEWIEHCSKPYGNNRRINIPGEDSGYNGYSYTWWTNAYDKEEKKIEMYSAGGWGGQHIMVLPKLDMVVVFTGGNYNSFRPPYKILRKYIIPATEIKK